jgi:hypothetical protein
MPYWNRPWKLTVPRERQRQLDQENNREHRWSISITRLYLTLLIHSEPEKIYAPWPVAAETRDQRAYLWPVGRESFDPNCFPSPTQPPQTRFECRALMILQISSIQSPLLVHKTGHDPQVKTNKSPFHTNHPALDQILTSETTAVIRGYTCDRLLLWDFQPLKIVKSLSLLLRTNTCGSDKDISIGSCNHQEFGYLLNSGESDAPKKIPTRPSEYPAWVA